MIPVIVSIRPENFTSFGGRVKKNFHDRIPYYRLLVIVLPFEFLARELENQTKTFSSALLSKLDNVFEFCSPSALSTGALWCHVK